MPYPRRLLNEGEELQLDLRPHWWFFSKHIGSGVPLFVVLVFILAKTHDLVVEVAAAMDRYDLFAACATVRASAGSGSQ